MSKRKEFGADGTDNLNPENALGCPRIHRRAKSSDDGYAPRSALAHSRGVWTIQRTAFIWRPITSSRASSKAVSLGSGPAVFAGLRSRGRPADKTLGPSNFALQECAAGWGENAQRVEVRDGRASAPVAKVERMGAFSPGRSSDLLARVEVAQNREGIAEIEDEMGCSGADIFARNNPTIANEAVHYLNRFKIAGTIPDHGREIR